MYFQKTAVLTTLACAVMFLPTVASASMIITGGFNIGPPTGIIQVTSPNSANFQGTPSATSYPPNSGVLGSAVGCSATIQNIASNAPIANFLSCGGFSFSVLNFSQQVFTFTTLADGSLAISAGFSGVVSGNGYSLTPFTGVISTQMPVGQPFNTSSSFSGTFVATAPEPGTMFLLGAGLIGIGFFSQRFRKPSAESFPK